MKTVSVYRLRNELANYLDTVNVNQTPLVVEKYNRPWVVITPWSKKIVKENDINQFFGFLKGSKFTYNRRSAKEKRYVRLLREGKVVR